MWQNSDYLTYCAAVGISVTLEEQKGYEYADTERDISFDSGS